MQANNVVEYYTDNMKNWSLGTLETFLSLLQSTIEHKENS